MTIVHSMDISAPRERVFALYADVDKWPPWDKEASDVHLPNGLQGGASGWLKPRKGPKARIKVAKVVPGRSFAIEGKLPLCRMHFSHDLDGDATHTTTTHSVQFTGPLAFVFRRLIGNGIDATLPETLRGLKQASEEATGAR